MIAIERINLHSILLILICFFIFYYKFVEHLPVAIDIMQVNNGSLTLVEANGIDTIEDG